MTTVTWNPADKAGSVTLTNGNLSVQTTSAPASVRATEGRSTGKWYWEILVVNQSNSWSTGIGLASASLGGGGAVGNATGTWGYYWASSVYYVLKDGLVQTSTAPSIVTGMIVNVALDLVNNKLWFGKNGVWFQGDPNTNTGGWAIAAGTWFPMQSSRESTPDSTANFGATAFSYTVPTGFTGYGRKQDLAADAAAVATATAGLGTSQHIAAAATAFASGSAALDLQHDLAAAAQAISIATASMRGDRRLGAAAGSIATAQAVLEIHKDLGASASDIVTGTGALDLRKHLAAAAAAVAQATEGLEVISPAGKVHMLALAAAISSAQASLEAVKAMIGPAEARATAEASLRNRVHMGANAQAQASAAVVKPEKPAVSNVNTTWRALVNHADPSQAEANRRELEYPFGTPGRRLYGDGARRGAYH